jgi:hypothetical protein
MTPTSATRRQSSNLAEAGFSPLPADGDVSKLISSDSDLSAEEADLFEQSLGGLSVSMSVTSPTGAAVDGVVGADPTAAAGDVDAPGAWEEFVDEATGFPYFVHSVTGESKWKEDDAGTTPRALTPGREDRGDGVGASAVPARDFTDGSWDRHIDPQSGMPYYLNESTGESVWADEAEAEMANAAGTPRSTAATEATAVHADATVETDQRSADAGPTSEVGLGADPSSHGRTARGCVVGGAQGEEEDEAGFGGQGGEPDAPDDAPASASTPVVHDDAAHCADDTETTPYSPDELQGDEGKAGESRSVHEAFDGSSPLWAAVTMCHRRDEAVAALAASQQRITLVAVCASIGAVLLVNKKRRPRGRSLSPRVFYLEDTIGDVVRALVAWGAAGPLPSQGGRAVGVSISPGATIPPPRRSPRARGSSGGGGTPPLVPTKTPRSGSRAGEGVPRPRGSKGASREGTLWRLFFPGGSVVLPFPADAAAWTDREKLEAHCARRPLQRRLAAVMAASPVAARLTVEELLVGVREVPFVCSQQPAWLE